MTSKMKTEPMVFFGGPNHLKCWDVAYGWPAMTVPVRQPVSLVPEMGRNEGPTNSVHYHRETVEFKIFGQPYCWDCFIVPADHPDHSSAVRAAMRLNQFLVYERYGLIHLRDMRVAAFMLAEQLMADGLMTRHSMTRTFFRDEFEFAIFRCAVRH